MEITTARNIGDVVYFMQSGKIRKGTISKIELTVVRSVGVIGIRREPDKYHVQLQSGTSISTISINTSNMRNSIQELLQGLVDKFEDRI